MARPLTLVAAHVGRSRAAFEAVLRNPELRRLQLAWFLSNSGEYAAQVGLNVWAYQAHGAFGIGLMNVVQMVTAGVLSPVTAWAADRFPRGRVARWCEGSRVLILGLAAAAVEWSAPGVTVYALGAAAMVATTAYYPARTALVPLVARSVEEAAAANAVSSLAKSAGALVGPLVAGLFLAAGSVTAALAASAAMWLVATVAVPVAAGVESVRRAEGRLYAEIVRGFSAAWAEPPARVALALFTAKNVGRAGSMVFVVALPLSLLGGQEGDAGFLSAAIGVGGILGAFAAAGFAERRAMAEPMGLGLALFGLSFAAIAVAPSLGLALVCLAANGLGNSVVDTSGYTLLSRSVHDQVLARVLGVVETLRTVSVAAGSILAPAAIDLIGLRATLVVFGLAMPLAALVERGALRRADAGARVPVRELALLRENHLFAPLLPLAAEQLAGRGRHVRFEDGVVLMQQGQPADCAYVIEAGTLRVMADGREVALLQRPDVAGEMGLLRSAPRNATVSAVGPVEALRLDETDFLAAIGGHPVASSRADELVAARWAALRGAAAD